MPTASELADFPVAAGPDVEAPLLPQLGLAATGGTALMSRVVVAQADPSTLQSPDGAASVKHDESAEPVERSPTPAIRVAAHDMPSILVTQPGPEGARSTDARIMEAMSDEDDTVLDGDAALMEGARVVMPSPASVEALAVAAAQPAPASVPQQSGLEGRVPLAETAMTGPAASAKPAIDDPAREMPAATQASPQETTEQGEERSTSKLPGARMFHGEMVAAGKEGLTVPAKMATIDGGLPSPLLTQAMTPVANGPAVSPYPAVPQAAVMTPVVMAQPGRIGADIGVEIARAAKGDREDVLIRLDPREMGRIDVRLSFDRDGMLRAVMSADSPAALDMLRRESGDLNRALADAGVRHDAQSFRFDARSGDQGQDSGFDQGSRRDQQDQGARASFDNGGDELADLHYRPLRASGQVDLMA